MKTNYLAGVIDNLLGGQNGAVATVDRRVLPLEGLRYRPDGLAQDLELAGDAVGGGGEAGARLRRDRHGAHGQRFAELERRGSIAPHSLLLAGQLLADRLFQFYGKKT